MNRMSVARGIVSGGVAVAASVGLYAAPAFAAAQVEHGNVSAAGMTFDLGQSPVDLPPSCPFDNGDANFVFTSGTAVFHDTTNNNGDWGGQTMQGTAIFYEGTTLLDQGHLTVWEGGGNNAKGQTDGGLTLSFNGAAVQIHVSGQMTTNAAGRPTAQPINVNVTCG